MCDDYSSPSVINCIFWENSAIVGAEIAIGGFSQPANLTVSYSNVQGGEAAAYVQPDASLYWLDRNIDADPLFVGLFDYHLSAGSPCIDTGTDAGVYTDIDGQSRPSGAGYDMGAYEFLPGPCKSRIVPVSSGPVSLYLIPALSLSLLVRRFCGKGLDR